LKWNIIASTRLLYIYMYIKHVRMLILYETLKSTELAISPCGDYRWLLYNSYESILISPITIYSNNNNNIIYMFCFRLYVYTLARRRHCGVDRRDFLYHPGRSGFASTPALWLCIVYYSQSGTAAAVKPVEPALTVSVVRVVASHLSSTLSYIILYAILYYHYYNLYSSCIRCLRAH